MCLGVTSENRNFSSFIFHSTQLGFFLVVCFKSSLYIWVPHNTWLYFMWFCLFGKERKLIFSQTRFRSVPFFRFRFRWRSLLHFAEDRSFWGSTLLLPGFRWINKYCNPKTVPCVLMNISASFRTLLSKACALSKNYTLWWASSWQAATFSRGWKSKLGIQSRQLGLREKMTPGIVFLASLLGCWHCLQFLGLSNYRCAS